MSYERILKAGFALTIVYIIVWLTVVSLIVYTAFHFIHKYW